MFRAHTGGSREVSRGMNLIIAILLVYEGPGIPHCISTVRAAGKNL